jgi:protein gp37
MYRLSPRFGRDPYKVNLTQAGLLGNVADALIRNYGKFIFVNSMSDTFHKDISDQTLDMWFNLFKRHPEKVFQILTKRPERAYEYFRARAVPPSCWIGTSVGIRATLPRLDFLRMIDAKRFVSAEPLVEDLGAVDFTGIHWVIIGGESGETPRAMRPEWAESLVKQAHEQGCKVWFKQMGGKGGGGAGGDSLNGRKIQEMPEV